MFQSTPWEKQNYTFRTYLNDRISKVIKTSRIPLYPNSPPNACQYGVPPTYACSFQVQFCFTTQLLMQTNNIHKEQPQLGCNLAEQKQVTNAQALSHIGSIYCIGPAPSLVNSRVQDKLLCSWSKWNRLPLEKLYYFRFSSKAFVGSLILWDLCSKRTLNKSLLLGSHLMLASELVRCWNVLLWWKKSEALLTSQTLRFLLKLTFKVQFSLLPAKEAQLFAASKTKSGNKSFTGSFSIHLSFWRNLLPRIFYRYTRIFNINYKKITSLLVIETDYLPYNT